MIRVVTGPPASGKSTYIAEHSREGDITIDLDLVLSSTGGNDTLARQLRYAMEEHAKNYTGGDVWIARTLPDPTDRTVFADRIGAGEVVVLNGTSREKLLERLAQRPGGEEHIEGVERWFALNGETPTETQTPERLYEMSEVTANVSTAAEIPNKAANAEMAALTQEPATTPSVEQLQQEIAKLQAEADKWKGHARTWEDRAKDNAKAESTPASAPEGNAELAALRDEFLAYKRQSNERLFLAELNNVAASHPGANVEAIAAGLDRSQFMTADGGVDRQKLNDYFQAFGVGASVQPPASEPTPRGLPAQFANPASGNDVKSSGSLEAGRDRMQEYMEKNKRGV